MSEESKPAAESSTASGDEKNSDNRKNSQRPKRKVAQKRAKKKVAEAPEKPIEVAAKESPEFPTFSEPSTGDAEKNPDAKPQERGSAEGNKRNRRRRKKPSQSDAKKDELEAVESQDSGPEKSEGREKGGSKGGSNNRRKPQPRAKHNSEALAKKAWKIYLAEISEEGVALVADQDAQELSKRCFRLAEIFLDEQSKHN